MSGCSVRAGCLLTICTLFYLYLSLPRLGRVWDERQRRGRASPRSVNSCRGLQKACSKTRTAVKCADKSALRISALSCCTFGQQRSLALNKGRGPDHKIESLKSVAV